VLAEDQKYMVVTYKTDITEKLPLKLGNFNNGYLTIADDATVSNGKYVRTNPVNIDTLEGASINYLERFRNINFQNFICIDTKQNNKSFFIKEIAFFSDLSAVKAYAKADIK
jgi:hypothetical protein